MNNEDYPVESPQNELVPMDTLEKIADAQAFELWGENIGRGEPIPLSDASGLYAYVFPYILNTRQFPSHETLFDQVRDLRSRHNVVPAQGDVLATYFSELRQFGSGFGSIRVSARITAGPVLQMSHFLPQYFITGESAREEAVRQLGGEVELNKYYDFSPEEQYIEFVSGTNTVLIDAVVPSRTVPVDALTRRPPRPKSEELLSEIRRSWERLTASTPGTRFDGVSVRLAPGTDVAPIGISVDDIAETHTEKRIAYWELIPKVDHTSKNWCVPSSWAMLLGFYDNYVKGKGTILGYGRLIDYWYELTPGGSNLPNLIDDWLTPPGPEAINNYTFPEKKTDGDTAKQWATLKAEIDAGRPCFFNTPPHSTAAFGYRVNSNGDKFAIVYDPPNPSIPTYENEYSLQECEEIGAVILSGETDGENLILMGPDGGETLHTAVPGEIIWYVYGNSIKKATLSLSEDGGNKWTTIADDIPTKAAWNRYFWIPPSGTRVRVKVEGFTAGDELIAADGSFGNATVQSQAASGGWSQICGQVGMVLAGYDKSKAARLIYVTDLATGDIYRFEGKPGVYWNWFQVGGPGKMFVLDGKGKLYRLSPDGNGVWQYSGTGTQWTQIGGPAKEIYSDVDGVCATNPATGDLYRYLGSPFAWRKVGGPGKTFASDAHGFLYGVSADGSGVWRYDGLFGSPVPWVKIGGPAANLYARGYGVFATNPQTGDIYIFHGHPFKWTRIGGPGKAFSVDVEGRLYGLSPDGSKVWRYDGSLNTPDKWTQIGGAAAGICAGWKEVLAINPQTKELWIYMP